MGASFPMARTALAALGAGACSVVLLSLLLQQ